MFSGFNHQLHMHRVQPKKKKNHPESTFALYTAAEFVNWNFNYFTIFMVIIINQYVNKIWKREKKIKWKWEYYFGTVSYTSTFLSKEKKELKEWMNWVGIASKWGRELRLTLHNISELGWGFAGPLIISFSNRWRME